MIRSKEGSTGKPRIRRVENVPVIGWREWLALPTLNIERIKVKIDTGARTSSIHATEVTRLTDRGAPHVSFVVWPAQRHVHPAIECVAEIQDQRLVTSSTGHRQRRYVIEVEARLGEITWPIEVTLADRDAMGFRMLLGREAIRSRFLIDSNRSFLANRCHADVSTIVSRKGKRI